MSSQSAKDDETVKRRAKTGKCRHRWSDVWLMTHSGPSRFGAEGSDATAWCSVCGAIRTMKHGAPISCRLTPGMTWDEFQKRNSAWRSRMLKNRKSKMTSSASDFLADLGNLLEPQDSLSETCSDMTAVGLTAA